MEEFLRFLISPLLTTPDELSIVLDENSAVIKVATPDVGRVIGKQGSVIHHLRTMVKTYCALHQIPMLNLVLDSPAKTD